MVSRLKELWHTRRLAFVVFFAALAVTVWFAGNFVAGVLYWNDPRHRNQALEPWMTPRYVQHSYALKPQVVAEILQIDHPFPHRMRMSDIIALNGMSYEALTAALTEQAEIAKAARKARGDE